MMPGMKKILQGLKNANREYILLFVVVVLLGLLIHSSTAVSQTPDEITLTTFYPAPFGEFDQIRASRMIDFDNVAFFIDPSGESRLLSLQIFEGLQVGQVYGPSGTYSINFVTGAARLGNLEAQIIHMIDAGPSGPAVSDGTDEDTVREVGKFVYDIAEGMQATDCSIGDVVIIGDSESEGLIKSEQRFDSRIAGVISEDPKIYMGPGEGKMPLALAGIVRCNVTAENGSINRGDLLVSSSLAGHAMKAEANQVKPGMVVGKAMQPLLSGTGKIFILVNKQ